MMTFSDVYQQVRPIVMLPFNIWFFFVTLPFRAFFFFSSFLTMQNVKSKTMEIREKAMEVKEEIKEEVKQVLPATLVHRAPIELRPARDSHALDENRIHGFFAVEKVDTRAEEKLARKSSKKSTEEKKEQLPKVDEKAELMEKITKMEERERKATEDKVKIEKEFEELSKKFQHDEAALAESSDEHKRYKSVIALEQRKCYDLTRQVVQLKLQLALTQEPEKLAEQTKKSKNSQKKQEQKSAEKVNLKTTASDTTDAAEDPLLHPHGWTKPEQVESFTEMVDRVQHEESEHGKSFSETLREAIHKDEPVLQKPTTAEFTVVGGPESNHHVFNPVSAK